MFEPPPAPQDRIQRDQQMNEAFSSAEGSAHRAAAQFSHRRRTLALVAVALAFVIDLLDVK